MPPSPGRTPPLNVTQQTPPVVTYPPFSTGTGAGGGGSVAGGGTSVITPETSVDDQMLTDLTEPTDTTDIPPDVVVAPPAAAQPNYLLWAGIAVGGYMLYKHFSKG